jgi:hypothetical protein
MFQHCDIRLSVTRFIGVQSQLHSQQYFSSISFIYGRNWRKPLRCHKPLTTLITKGCIKYTPPSFPRIKGHNFKTISTNSILYKNVQYVHYFCIDVCNFLIQLSYNVITGIKLKSTKIWPRLWSSTAGYWNFEYFMCKVSCWALNIFDWLLKLLFWEPSWQLQHKCKVLSLETLFNSTMVSRCIGEGSLEIFKLPQVT